MAQGTDAQRKVRDAMQERGDEEVTASTVAELLEVLNLREKLKPVQFQQAVSGMTDYRIVRREAEVGKLFVLRPC